MSMFIFVVTIIINIIKVLSMVFATEQILNKYFLLKFLYQPVSLLSAGDEPSPEDA